MGQIVTLGLTDDIGARLLLERARDLVSPIMKKYGWKIGQLREFLPRSKKLLGMNTNRGQIVEIRLRRQTRSRKENHSIQYVFDSKFFFSICFRFFPFEAVVGTLLHELVHNAIDRHGSKFNQVLHKITEECEAIMVDKVKIPTVQLCGQVLGGDHEAFRQFSKRDLSRFAAESRLVLLSSEVDACENDVVILE